MFRLDEDEKRDDASVYTTSQWLLVVLESLRMTCYDIKRLHHEPIT